MVFRSTDLPTPVGPMTTEELPCAGAKSLSFTRGRSPRKMEKPLSVMGAVFMPLSPPARRG